MVTIERVNTTGAFSFGWCKTISLFNTGLVHIFGENGVGKSSILNVIRKSCLVRMIPVNQVIM